MNLINLKSQWQQEEQHAFQGWDFSHLDGRWESEKLPWDYREIVLSYLKSTDRLLDMGTGGGEFLLTLGHTHALTSVTEAYPPNAELCWQRLSPLGITVVQIDRDDSLPFEDESFDIVLNRHESFDLGEVRRILKRGGFFITQQVGGRNDREFSQRLIEDFVPSFEIHTLDNNINALKEWGFEILMNQESLTTVRFFDVGALVYFAKTVPWEFPGFSVEKAFDRLCRCQEELEDKGFLAGTEHRFLIVSKKMEENKISGTTSGFTLAETGVL